MTFYGILYIITIILGARMNEMYMPIAQELYDKVKEKYKNNDIILPANKPKEEGLIDYFFEAIIKYSTDLTVGKEGVVKIPYQILDCFKTINPKLAARLETKIDKHFDELKTVDIDSFSQFYFHYNIEHVKNLKEILDKREESAAVTWEKLDEKYPGLHDVLNKICAPDKEFATEDLHVLSDKMKSLSVPFETICDDLEFKLKNSFTNSINTVTEETKEMLSQQSSRLKILDGQGFNLLVHSSGEPDHIMEQKEEKGFSASLVDQGNINHCSSGPDSVLFAFNQKLVPQDIATATAGDAGAECNDAGIWKSQRVPDFLPIDDYKEATKNPHNGEQPHTEINLNKTVNLQPSAIVCYDVVTYEELDMAKKFDLDIILIDTSKYGNMLKPADLEARQSHAVPMEEVLRELAYSKSHTADALKPTAD